MLHLLYEQFEMFEYLAPLRVEVFSRVLEAVPVVTLREKKSRMKVSTLQLCHRFLTLAVLAFACTRMSDITCKFKRRTLVFVTERFGIRVEIHEA